MNETQRMLELLTSSFPSLASMGALEARAAVDARIRPAANLEDALASDAVIEGPGGALPIRTYRPVKNSTSTFVTVYAHGGGFLHGSIEGHDAFCRTWAKHTGTPVVSVGYRLAPEHGAPSGSDDLMAAAAWAVGEGLGDTVVLAGDSSGANLAAVAALALRGDQRVRTIAQVLLYPFLDPTMSSESYRRLGDSNFITASNLATYWQHYLSAPGTSEAEPWQVNPALAPSHEGAPPAIVITAGLDPLQDEGRNYAALLRRCGTPTLLRHYPDQFHGFATIAGYRPARSAQRTLWSDLRHLLTTHPH